MILVLYIVFLRSFTIKHSNDNIYEEESPELTGNFIEKILSRVSINLLNTNEGRKFFANFIGPIDPDSINIDYMIKISEIDPIQTVFNIIDSKPNDDEIFAICGQEVLVDYRIKDKSGKIINSESKSIVLGQKSITPILDILTPGMKIDQTRSASIPAEYILSDTQKDYDKIIITLKGINSKSSINPNEVRIFDNRSSYALPLLCGDSTRFHVKIINLCNNKLIFNQEISQYQIGDSRYPLIFAYAMHRKIPFIDRSVIVSGKLLDSEIINLKNISKDSMYLLEFSNF